MLKCNAFLKQAAAVRSFEIPKSSTTSTGFEGTHVPNDSEKFVGKTGNHNLCLWRFLGTHSSTDFIKLSGLRIFGNAFCSLSLSLSLSPMQTPTSTRFSILKLRQRGQALSQEACFFVDTSLISFSSTRNRNSSCRTSCSLKDGGVWPDGCPPPWTAAPPPSLIPSEPARLMRLNFTTATETRIDGRIYLDSESSEDGGICAGPVDAVEEG